MALNPAKLLEPVKKHPFLIGGAIIGGAVVLYLIYKAQRSGGAVAVQQQPQAAGVDPTASLAASVQLQEAAYQLQGQTNQIQGTLDLAGLQAKSALALQSEQDASTLANNELAAQVATFQIGSQTDLAKYQTAATENVQLQGLTTQVQLATIETGLQEAIANTNAAVAVSSIQSSADVQKTLATLQAQTMQHEADVTSNVQLAQIGAQKQASTISGIGGIVGSVLGAFF